MVTLKQIDDAVTAAVGGNPDAHSGASQCLDGFCVTVPKKSAKAVTKTMTELFDAIPGVTAKELDMVELSFTLPGVTDGD